MTKTIASSEVKEQLPRYLREAAEGEFVLITRYGEPVAALISLDAFRRIEPEPVEQGLAGLVGLWDDCDDFVDDVQEATRNRRPSRPLPDLEDPG